MIPFVDLGAQYQALRREISESLAEVLASTSFVKGPVVDEFEREFAAFCEASFAVGVANGTDALHLALRAIGAGPGSKVFTVPNTFVATAEAISHAGATIRLVDIDESTWLMDAREVEAQADSEGDVLLPVHLYGHAVDFDALEFVAERRGMAIVEDAAQAHGARYGSRAIGSLGKVACFSFYPGKNLGAYGDGGAVVTSDQDVADRIRLLGDHGSAEKYHHEVIGWNSRLDTMQAAVLLVKLRHLKSANSRRRELAAAYRERLSGISEIRWPSLVPDSEPVHHLLVVSVPSRDEMREYLWERGVQTGIHYPVPIHLQPAFRSLGYGVGDFPVSEQLAGSIVSLPMYPELTEEQVERVCEDVREFFSAE